MVQVTVKSKKGIQVFTMPAKANVAMAIANKFSRIDKRVVILSVVSV